MITRAAILSLALTLPLLWTAPPLHAQQPEDASQTQAASLDPEALAAFLPETVAGWQQVPSGTSRRHERLATARGLYTKDDAQLQVVISDLAGRPPRIETGPGASAPTSWPEYLTAARAEAEQGEAREVQYGDVLGFEGTGTSDDVVFPHGVMALPGRRFQVAVYEVREGLSSVADVKALPEHELNAMLDRARTLLQALDLDGLASRADAAEQHDETLRALLPDTLAGMMRGRIREDPEQPLVAAAYGKEGVPFTLNARLGAGDVARRFRAGIEEEYNEPDADVRMTTREGYTLYLKRHRGESTVSLIAFPGEMMVMLNALGPAGESFDTDAATDRLVRAFDALDPARLAAFQMPRAAVPDAATPAGFETYAADWPSGRIALTYPEAWTLTDLLARTGWAEAVSLTSSAEAAEVLYGEGISMSTEDTVRLVTPQNAIVSVGMMGVEAEGTPPLRMIEVMDGSAVADAEVTQPPHAVTLDDGAEAAMREVRGTDADGRAVVGQQWALASGGQLVSVSAFLPAERAEELAPTLRTLLESISVTPK